MVILFGNKKKRMNIKSDKTKHQKYIDFFKSLKQDEKTGEYWGLGIENESYLMLSNPVIKNRNILNNHKRERYSVDYYINYNMDLFSETLKTYMERKDDSATSTINMPMYINGYMFQNVDIHGQHKTHYSISKNPNKKYCGMSIDEYMNYVSPGYKRLFEKNVAFDGDTIEFITSNFFKTTVKNVVDELSLIKMKFMAEIDRHLSKKLLFKNSSIIYPPYNYGFVSFLTNEDNLGICNNGTYHLNITLPTKMSNDNKSNDVIINDMDLFREKHSNAIRMIQLMEPLLIALYGSPDILNTISKKNDNDNDNIYCGGSLRIMMSRYIGLGTYDSDKMEPGKKLDDCIPPDYFERLHKSSYSKKRSHDQPYFPGSKIGFDVNYNKFKNHGIELRIFDYFPEEYLCDVLNFILLLCEHSLFKKIDKPQTNNSWNDMAIQCIKTGSDTKISQDFYDLLVDVFDINIGGMCGCFSTKPQIDVYKTVNKISKLLYKRYVGNLDHYNNNPTSIIKKMSPDMKPIQLVDYNKIIKKKFEDFI